MDAPELWRLVEDVARRLEVQTVDSIQINPDVGIGVNEKGNILMKMRGKGKRNLLLGMGALGGLTQGQFSGILAHEFGHFSNRDTAGGNLAHQVYSSLNQMAVMLIKRGAARFYNPVWLFLVGYQRIFLRITLGASRLQEVLADRFAAVAYGSENFIEGLKKYIRQSIAFPMQSNYELRNAFEMHRNIVNLYDVPLQDNLEREMWLEFEKTMTLPTSKNDSHPAPMERIRYIEKLSIPYSPIHDNPRSVLELFPNLEELQREMTIEITNRLKK
jgi:Zn-dependent protease with chaperone function